MQPHQELGELLRLAIDDLADEDHRRFGGAGRGQERTEVGVSRDDGPCFGECEVDDLRVGRSRCVEVANVHGGVTGLGEQICQPRWQVLVDE